MEVKKTFLATLIVILTFLMSCSEELKEVDFSSLQDRNGVMYEVNTEDPFTGIGVTKFDNGQNKNSSQERSTSRKKRGVCRKRSTFES